VPPEGVVRALHRIHAALVPDGRLIDTQPTSAHPPVEAGGAGLGTLDMRDWRRQIDTIDALTRQVLEAGLYAVEVERHVTVSDVYDTGAECAEVVGQWKGTRVPPSLARRLRSVSAPASVHQQVRLRVLRRREPRPTSAAP
jgi:hypothetical protein